ncbi:hypothetical protein H1W37_15085 [Stappia taiwanensis]|uniref:Uncharacterized protein n=1 Tax=Stappia taiwanensis TaxID=992267 RepID=A0A838XRA3_9HYPH|nr:hypothetical protein [Stappia taiwanensis]MBA4612985.1 hypothetical protein [Stappia taiwanensis]
MNEHQSGAPLHQGLAATHPISVINLRRTLRVCAGVTKQAAEQLSALQNGAKLPTESDAYVAIAAVAIGERFPIEISDNNHFLKALELARQGKMSAYVDDAVDEVGSVLRLMEKALRGLELLDHLPAPMPTGWANLPAPALARAITKHCLAIIGPTSLR